MTISFRVTLAAVMIRHPCIYIGWSKNDVDIVDEPCFYLTKKEAIFLFSLLLSIFIFFSDSDFYSIKYLK